MAMISSPVMPGISRNDSNGDPTISDVSGADRFSTFLLQLETIVTIKITMIRILNTPVFLFIFKLSPPFVEDPVGCAARCAVRYAARCAVLCHCIISSKRTYLHQKIHDFCVKSSKS